MKIAVLNDTAAGFATTGGNHFGCELVMETLYDQLAKHGHEVVQKVPSNKRDRVSTEVDLVIVNGEGSLHSGRRRELVDVAMSRPAILINTVWQRNQPTNLQHFKHITVRESLSAKEMGCNPEVIPDLLFANERLINHGLFTQCNQDYDIGETDSVFAQGKYGMCAIASAKDYIIRLQDHKRVVCGRFHGVAACAVLGIPFSAYKSNTHKIEGMMADMGILEHFHNSRENALAACPTEFNPKIKAYADDAKIKIDNLFNNLERFV